VTKFEACRFERIELTSSEHGDFSGQMTDKVDMLKYLGVSVKKRVALLEPGKSLSP